MLVNNGKVILWNYSTQSRPRVGHTGRTHRRSYDVLTLLHWIFCHPRLYVILFRHHCTSSGWYLLPTVPSVSLSGTPRRTMPMLQSNTTFRTEGTHVTMYGLDPWVPYGDDIRGKSRVSLLSTLCVKVKIWITTGVVRLSQVKLFIYNVFFPPRSINHDPILDLSQGVLRLCVRSWLATWKIWTFVDPWVFQLF
jgi:hypothetical protein